ncbi:MAG: aminopeptidase P N-terminal domain-containing protein [Bacteroidia bacterium]|nr:aminopeptidase P N-terminal domain-containing protein [Bacteroidia bacterium]
MKIIVTALFLIFHTDILIGQDFKYYQYDKDLLPASFHTDRREEVRKKMPANSVAILFSNPVRNRSIDNDYTYHQDPNFYYLTGFNEPNSVLIIYKDSISINDHYIHEILFVPIREKSREIWNGRRAGIEGAKIISGVRTVFYAEDFLKRSSLFSDTSLKILHLSMHKGVVNEKANPFDLFELTEYFKSVIDRNTSKGDSFSLSKIFQELREIKTEAEINLMRRSISITCKGFIAMMQSIKPGMTEYQIQAIGEYEFKKFGAETEGYPSICGSKENSTILHYSSNRRTLNDSDLILLDMGAEYHGYSADVTRTIPANGKFTPDQKLIYELVLKAQNAGIKACVVGNEFSSTHKAAVEVLSEGLVKLGIIKDPSDYDQYYMTGTSHYLGLDVHDVGTRTPFKAGTVITVEPGIYIAENSDCDPKWWNIGVRIEDDILITDAGPVNLSAEAPKNVEEIENLHGQTPVMNK